MWQLSYTRTICFLSALGKGHFQVELGSALLAWLKTKKIS